MTKKFRNEIILSNKDLNEFAENILSSINLIQPIDILSNIIDKETYYYLGKEYFKDFEKNSIVGYSKYNNDFSGLYILYNDDKVVYVGISNSIIRKIKLLLIAKHNVQSNLVYLIAKKMYEDENKKVYKGSRSEFPIEKNII